MKYDAVKVCLHPSSIPSLFSVEQILVFENRQITVFKQDFSSKIPHIYN